MKSAREWPVWVYVSKLIGHIRIVLSIIQPGEDFDGVFAVLHVTSGETNVS